MLWNPAGLISKRMIHFEESEPTDNMLTWRMGRLYPEEKNWISVRDSFMKPIYVTKTPSMYRIQFEYHPKLVEVIKRIPSRPRYDGQTARGLWQLMISVIRVERMQIGMSGLFRNGLFRCVSVQPLNGGCIWRDQLWYSTDETFYRWEHYMLLQPAYEYQLEGVQYAIEHKRCFFGDQPGLGKTLQAICAVVKA